MFLTRISVGHPVFATMMMLAMVVVVAFFYTRLTVEQLPDIDFPVVTVVQSYLGTMSEAVVSTLAGTYATVISSTASGGTTPP